MKKKISVFIILLIFLFSCGNKKSSEILNEENKEKNNMEIEKYNSYVNFYNLIIKTDESIRTYFEAAGTKLKVKKEKEGLPIPVINLKMIEKDMANLNKMDGGNKLTELMRNLIPVIEEMKSLTDEINVYYKERGYLSDNYKKGNEFHTEFLEISKKYKEISDEYKTEFRLRAAEKKKENFEDMKNQKKTVKYNLILFIDISEKFLDEIQNKKLDSQNFIKSDPESFKIIYAEITEQFENLKNEIKDKEQMKKENFQNSDFTSFILYAERFSASIKTFIERMEKKEAGHVSEKSSASEDTGTPENIFKEYNNIVEEYNKLIN